jgi:hypothetical protein
MLATPGRFDAASAPMMALRAAIDESAYGPAIARVAATTQALLRRKFPQVLATAEQDNALAKSVQLDLIGALFAIEESARVRFPIASDLLFLYSEGRLPCAWDSGGITAVF